MVGALIGEDGGPDKARETKISSVFSPGPHDVAGVAGPIADFGGTLSQFGPARSLLARRAAEAAQGSANHGSGGGTRGGTARRGKHWRSRAAH